MIDHDDYNDMGLEDDREDGDVYCKACRQGPLTELELEADQPYFPSPMCEECIKKAEAEDIAEAQADALGYTLRAS